MLIQRRFVSSVGFFNVNDGGKTERHQCHLHVEVLLFCRCYDAVDASGRCGGVEEMWLGQLSSAYSEIPLNKRKCIEMPEVFPEAVAQ